MPRKAPPKKAVPKKTKLDQFVDAQKDTVERFSEFAGKMATLSMTGNYQPQQWVDAWKALASGLADVTKVLLKD